LFHSKKEKGITTFHLAPDHCKFFFFLQLFKSETNIFEILFLFFCLKKEKIFDDFKVQVGSDCHYNGVRAL
jgi:hypothetical protein